MGSAGTWILIGVPRSPPLLPLLLHGWLWMPVLGSGYFPWLAGEEDLITSRAEKTGYHHGPEKAFSFTTVSAQLPP
ncbi:hypothetical protein BO82DRAFT_351062 [Aspergillus uvarum CBS 121591]|uniref:Uncharacterized protein n=1 Tax=Aspergillus uvarum CBS 121591 TaxID=1448315 RepID=A0A319D3Z3_9EURO|nr:hypothetical protein BO82DRAFT_351062 [Aspergillus uvarum CBS 121591]PYH85743.1 hypothetical protein BO82DRAFT_351062 [Aspergillus uvarum CBS 121591]